MKNTMQTPDAGIKISMVLCPAKDQGIAPNHMLQVIALALNMNPECYRMRKRQRPVTELRFIGAYLLRMHFPKMRLHEIATLFGGQDHSSVLNGLSRVNELIYTGDKQFIEKYKIASRSVELWIQKEITSYAPAATA